MEREIVVQIILFQFRGYSSYEYRVVGGGPENLSNLGKKMDPEILTSRNLNTE